MTFDSRRLAVLIDGDFVDPESLGRVIAEASRHGDVAIRRIYANPEKLSAWAECFRRHRIESIPNYSDGHNAADHTLIIDTVEMLCSRKKIDGFCIVASDDDFAGLVNWIRKKKVFVVGISSRDKSPSSFKKECDIFRYVEDLPQSDNPDPASQRMLSEWKEAVRNAIGMSASWDGWALMSEVGSHLEEIAPHAYCHGNLLSLIKSCPEFKTREPGQVRLRTAES